MRQVRAELERRDGSVKRSPGVLEASADDTHLARLALVCGPRERRYKRSERNQRRLGLDLHGLLSSSDSADQFHMKKI
eukprot:scaffold10482_cov116-Isochrysis_galbana.AAC.12